MAAVFCSSARCFSRPSKERSPPATKAASAAWLGLGVGVGIRVGLRVGVSLGVGVGLEVRVQGGERGLRSVLAHGPRTAEAVRPVDGRAIAPSWQAREAQCADGEGGRPRGWREERRGGRRERLRRQG